MPISFCGPIFQGDVYSNKYKAVEEAKKKLILMMARFFVWYS